MCVPFEHLFVRVCTWPQSLTAANTAVNALHLFCFGFFSFFASFFPLNPSIQDPSMKDKLYWATSYSLQSASPLPVSSDPFPAEKIEGKPLLRQKMLRSTLGVFKYQALMDGEMQGFDGSFGKMCQKNHKVPCSAPDRRDNVSFTQHLAATTHSWDLLCLW